MKHLYSSILFLLIVLNISVTAQYYETATGNVAGGTITTTNNFLKSPVIESPKIELVRNKQGYTAPTNVPLPENITMPVQYFEDQSKVMADTQTIVLNSFTGLPQTNNIPPDPYMATGPTHIMVLVNSQIGIYDKEGNLIKNITADNFYSTTLSGVSTFDPKVSYDHFSKRWIMVWLDQNDSPQRGNIIVSVSDDSIPTGTWYNWVTPSNANGSQTTSNWGDYQGVGFDDKAIYITTNQFEFGGSFQYSKIRIIPKAQLYANTAGAITYTDFFNIGYPAGGPSFSPFTLRPTIPYTAGEDYYLVHAPNFTNGANYFSIFKISNVLTNPTLSGYNVPVSYYYAPPTASQLGGGMAIENGGTALKFEPIVRDGFLWAVHSVRNPNATTYSAIQYLKINLSTKQTVEDYIYGKDGFWHYYPAIAVDKNQNIAITFSRSGTTEYIGAYYITRLKSDAAGFKPISTIMTGKGNYVKDFGSNRNRWGDYMGIWLDPVTENNIWMSTEFAAATNTWGVQVAEIRLVPYPGVYMHYKGTPLDFGNVEVNKASDTMTVAVPNYGTLPFTISSIAQTSGQFKHVTAGMTFPYTVQPYDTLRLKFVFNPTTAGQISEYLYPISSNSTTFTGVKLKGKGYQIAPVTTNTIYGSTGAGNSGNIITINPSTGVGTNLGLSLYTEVKGIAVNPKTKVIYGISTNVTDTKILRVNSNLGDSYELFSAPIPNMAAITFDTTGAMILVAKTGKIYKADLTAKTLTQISDSKLSVSSAAIHPKTNVMWVSNLVLVGANKDKIYKVNYTTGDTATVGKTGFNLATNALVFDFSGNLYGTTGASNAVNNFIKIDTTTAAGTIIGSTGLNNVIGLATFNAGPTEVETISSTIPSDFTLRQNYPNPFNPSTVIEFSLPVASNVRLVVYNLLGEVVKELINTDVTAGTHKAVWNSTDNSGSRIASGIYFYELKATGENGNEFYDMKKMIYLK